jgi:DNA-binding winged helix-turn-helix (wHTH) protein
MRVRFGEYTLDTGSRELLRDEQPVHLTGKAFRLLEVLVEQRPNALSKDDLQDRVWPGVFVSEANLTSLMAELRTALRDDARRPRFVRTVFGFGYAFCGEAADAAPPSPTPRCVGVSRFRLVWGRREIVLVEGESILGRGPESLEWIDSDSVSRRHARIVVAGDVATIEDLGSKNGTFLRGQPVEAATQFSDGDQIRLGSVSLVVRMLAQPGSTATQVRGRK